MADLHVHSSTRLSVASSTIASRLCQRGRILNLGLILTRWLGLDDDGLLVFGGQRPQELGLDHLRCSSIVNRMSKCVGVYVCALEVFLFFDEL